MSDLIVNIQGAVADSALDQWRATLTDSIRVNRGIYVGETRVSQTESAAIVHDGMSVYGPWLEGQGSRNYPRTRFKGYGAARDAAEKINARAVEVAAPVVVTFVEAQNR